MRRKHPARTEVTEWRVQWLLEQGRIEEASATLFEETQRAPSAGQISTHVAFLREHKGDESAAGEIERLLKARPGIAGADLYRSELAEIEIALGRVSEAIASFAAVAHGDGPPPVRAAATLKLAEILERSGEGARARREIDQLLRWNPANVEARKLRAEWLIQSGDAERAIEDLLAASSQSRRDARIALLLGEAYLMQGSDALASEQLALAFEYSDSGAAEAARFADFLIATGQLEVAGHVLTVARIAHEDDLDLLERASRVYSALGETIRSKELAVRLRDLGGGEFKRDVRHR
jgi:predicted Zn-dependent protease